MVWRQLTFYLPSSIAPNVIEEQLTLLDAQAITLQDAGDQALFEQTPHSQPLWTQLQITALFADTDDPKAITTHLVKHFALDPTTLQWEDIADQAWQQRCQQQFQPMCIADRLWIIPSWHETPDRQTATMILDPGLAFGTGAHPTTQLCLTWLAQQKLPGKTVIDYGCGSGILAIAAMKLGAITAIAHDLEDQALQATSTNAQRNHIAATQLLITDTPPDPSQTADIVIANILANTLIELAPRLTPLVKPGGHLVLSGILTTQASAVVAAYQPEITFDPIHQQDDWVCLIGRHCPKL
ncbi:MAG: 50S ribosomal protein L11 methyltransferase [Legionellales bacterium]|nr:50S ribosomal protein L11 methyltransferase [Legionellales bacterium]